MRIILYQLAAAFTFFTRIPVWKWCSIPSEAFSRIIGFWAITGWVTGGITALSWLLLSSSLPSLIALILTLVVRILLTGAIHEDGLSDFLDGFGGGKTKDDILRIMKDSHTGSFAIIGLILYFSLTINALHALPKAFVATVIFVADPLAKSFAAMLTTRLPYARTAEASKAKTVFVKLSIPMILFNLLCGILPLLFLLPVNYWVAALFPIVTAFFLQLLFRTKIGGYTGDLCGATFLLCELSFYLGMLLILF